jgi:hypothetical protein
VAGWLISGVDDAHIDASRPARGFFVTIEISALGVTLASTDSLCGGCEGASITTGAIVSAVVGVGAPVAGVCSSVSLDVSWEAASGGGS